VISSVATARLVTARPRGPWAPGFIERAHAAALPSTMAQMTIRTPAYLTDLGLRRWTDPGQFFALNLQLSPDIEEAHSDLQLLDDISISSLIGQWESDLVDDSTMTGHLESALVFSQSDDLARQIGAAIASSRRKPSSIRMMIDLASVMANIDAAKALSILDAACAQTPDPIGKALIMLRQASVLVKRAHDHSGASDVMDKMERLSALWCSEYRISESDQRVVLGVVKNLRALSATQAGDLEGALHLVEEAVKLIGTENLVTVEADMAARYRAQARINRAQAQEAMGRRSEAVQTAVGHVDLVREDHPFSLSEGLLVASIFCAKSGDHSRAFEYAQEAELLVMCEASPTRLAHSRRMKAIALDGMGRSAEARAIVETISEDPLGLRLLEEAL